MKKIIFSLLCALSLSATEQQVIPSGSANLFCQVMGEGSPLIVLHGGPGLSHDYLLPQMDALAENHQVIFYDQRASGRSEGGEDQISVDVFVEDLEAVRKKFGFEKVSLIGHSWGGFLAMNYAIAHSEHIDKLVLLNSMPADAEGLAIFLGEWSHRLGSSLAELEEIKHSSAFISGDPETAANYLKIQFRTYCALPEKADELSLLAPPESNKKGVKTANIFTQILFRSDFDLKKDLQKLKCKTLVLHGDCDVVPASTAETTHKNIPGSKLVVIENCGHFPYVEKPEEFFAILNEFL